MCGNLVMLKKLKATRLRYLLGFLCLLVLTSASALHGEQGQEGQDGIDGQVYFAEIKAMINPGALSVLSHAIETAEKNHAEALVIRLNTPGGLLSTTRSMVNAISESHVPVIVYVGPVGASATSAGSFILLASHLAVMNEGTNVGAASPISGSGGDIEGTLGKKVMNDTRAFMRSIAEERARNISEAEKFVSEAHSLTAQEALNENVIDAVVPDQAELLDRIHGMEIRIHNQTHTFNTKGKKWVEIERRLFDRLLIYIAHPQVAYLLTSLGTLGIYVEILSPGLIFPGVLGAIFLVLGLIALQTLPLNVGFIVLMILGIVLMVAEIFVSGFGALGIGGFIAFVLGSLNLFDDPSSVEYRNMILTISIGVGGAIAALGLFVARVFGSPVKRRLKHRVGEAMVSFDREGHVLIAGETWRAETVEPLKKGDRVVVMEKISHDRVKVKKQLDDTIG